MKLFKKSPFMALLCHIFLLLTMPFQTKASLKDFNSTINLNSHKIEAHQLLTIIENQTNINFIYDKNQIASIEIKYVNFKNKNLGEALSELQKETALVFRVINNSSIAVTADFKKSSIPEKKVLRQKSAILSGRVISNSNNNLSDASVKIIETGKVTKTDKEGRYEFKLLPGTYTLEVSYISFQTRRITGIIISSSQNKELDIVLKESKEGLEAIAVTGNLRRASVEGHYLRQKNESTLSNGLSAEQIANLPDKNIGETLKRISGLSTNENRRVVVRGIAERYNVAMMDGAVLPSSDVQIRDFEFDIVPANLVDNVIVNKTATPDMSFGFGGGLVQINTMAIPEKNFLNINYGTKYTNGSTGKEFLGYGRGKMDYLGFDDGGRNHFPKDLLVFDAYNYKLFDPWNYHVPEGVKAITPKDIAEQNKRIGGLERMGTRVYQTLPGQNLQFSLGKNYNFEKSRLGFVGSISYRNEQQIDDVGDFGRGEWERIGNKNYDAETGKEELRTTAKQYNFNTSWAGLLNVGFQYKNHKITSRNFYSRTFNNQFVRIVGIGYDIGSIENIGIKEYDRPKFINLLQNKIIGEHQFGSLKFDWNIAKNRLRNNEQDATEALISRSITLNDTTYGIAPSALSNPGGGTFNRSQYDYTEINTMAEASLTYNFDIKEHKQSIKAGYQYLNKVGTYDWMILPIGIAKSGNNYQLPIEYWGKYLEFKDPLKDLFYFPASFSNNGYKGENINHAYFMMMDNKIGEWFSFVWGMRGEYYEYKRLEDGTNNARIVNAIAEGDKTRFVDPKSGRIVSSNVEPEWQEKKWRYLPSFNLTLRPTSTLNFRAGYALSAVRPSLLENSKFTRLDPMLGVIRINEGVLSTIIDHYDLRLEWYPKLGEVISIGYFYKYFDSPVEHYRTVRDAEAKIYLFTKNSDWAKVKGWEFDIRKSLGFIMPKLDLLNDLYINGNLTIQNSEVQSSFMIDKNLGSDGKKSSL